MNRRKGYVGAADLMAELQRDPEWVARNAERQATHDAKVANIAAETEAERVPLNADLSAVGYAVKSVWDLVNMKEAYPEAIPVLLRHLPIVKHPIMRQGIGRALAVVEARGLAGSALLQALRHEQDPETRWVFANTLAIVADRENAEELSELADDPEYADVRERLSQALKNVT
jgi:hypothetical protein